MTQKDHLRRKAVNARSLNEATHFRQEWSAEEDETLLGLWNDVHADQEALAALLGRTVEACRQHRYALLHGAQARAQAKKQAAVKAVKTVDRWAKGFTSLDEMGY